VPDLPIPIFLAQDAPPATPAMDGGTSGTGTPDAPASSGSGPSMWWIWIAIFVIFYMMLIRPQSKEKRKREDLLKALKKRDRVIMTSGIHGEIIEINDKTATVEIAKGVRILFDRAAIWQIEANASTAPSDGKPMTGDATPAGSGNSTGEKPADLAKGKA
jgi:preprotein translocase subunit YajC